MGISEGTVLSRAKREGWTRKIQSGKALAKREDVLVATPVEAVAMSMQQRGERHVERMGGISERGVDYIETMDGPGNPRLRRQSRKARQDCAPDVRLKRR